MMHGLGWIYPFINGLGLGVAPCSSTSAGISPPLALGVRVKHVGMKWNKGLYTVRGQGTVQQNLLIALAGPFVNLLLIATTPWLPIFGLANFCSALANMLPINGSDGIRIAACWHRIRHGEIESDAQLAK